MPYSSTSSDFVLFVAPAKIGGSALSSWAKPQADLLDFSDAGGTIKNPSRELGLAGSLYINKSDKTVEIAQIFRNSEKKYTFEELRRIILDKIQTTNNQLNKRGAA